MQRHYIRNPAAGCCERSGVRPCSTAIANIVLGALVNDDQAFKVSSAMRCLKQCQSMTECQGCLPSSSWHRSGSGVYMGLDGWRMYCVEWKVWKASPFRKSLGCRSPATGRICHPVWRCSIWDKFSSWGTCTISQVRTQGILLQSMTGRLHFTGDVIQGCDNCVSHRLPGIQSNS